MIVPLLEMPLVITELESMKTPAQLLQPMEIRPALEICPVMVLALATRMPFGPPGAITPVALLTTFPVNEVALTVMQVCAPLLVKGNGMV